MKTKHRNPISLSTSQTSYCACLAGLLAAGYVQNAAALEWRIQPRVTTGFMHYSLDYDPIVSTGAGSPASGANNSSVERFSVSDNMPSIAGGATLFIDRFFIDVTAQYAFNGSASSKVNAIFNRSDAATGTVARVSPSITFDSDIERIEYAFTVGYQINQNFNVYAGYRNSETALDQRLSGNISSNIPAFAGNIQALGDFVFDNSGPFVGTTYTWDFSDSQVPGALTGNLGLAFLDGSNTFTTSNVKFNGSPVVGDRVPSAIRALRPPSQGDTVGLSIGVSWRGRTAISGLTYSAGASGYRYEFDNSQAGGANFDETLIRLDVGLAYAFQL